MSLKSWLRGKIYWLITDGPVGTICGTIMRGRACDALGRVVLPEEAQAETVAAIAFGVYEYPERQLIGRWLPRDVDCVELGCSIGIISRVILSRLQPSCRLIAVEASQELLGLAKRNIQAANLSSRLVPLHGAIHYDGDYVVFANDANHIRGRVATSRHSSGTKTPCVLLNHIIRENKLQSFSLVMDIEGAEFDLIAHDIASLSGCKAMIAEIHGGEKEREEFVKTLANEGFNLMVSKHSVFAFLRSHIQLAD